MNFAFIQKALLSKWMHFLMLSGLLIFACSLIVYENSHVQKLQFVSFDQFNKLAPREASGKVVVVDIDEASLQALGQWPWPRHVVGRIISRLKTLGAKTVSFDMVFAEKDRTSPENFLANLSDVSRADSVRETLEGLPVNDELLGQSIKSARNVITAFTAAQKDETRRDPLLRRPFQTQKDSQEALNALKERAYLLSGAATNLPVISKYSAGSGAFISLPEFDGIIRKIPLVMRYQAGDAMHLYPTLALETARVSSHRKDSLKIGKRENFAVQRGGEENASLSVFDTEYFIKIGASPLVVPLAENGYFWVHYKRVDKENEYVSAHKIYDEAYEKSVIDQVKGKHVFIASSSEGLKDVRSTPLDVFVPGVEVHLNVLEQILQQRFLTRPKSLHGAEMLYIAVFGLLMIGLANFIGALALGSLCLAIIGMAMAGAYHAYVEYGLLLDPLYPSIAVFALFVASVMFNYLRSESEKKAVRGAFGLYISPDFMQELTKNPDKLKLGGEIRDLTVMFSDIRNFTTISESMTPEALINTMNDFLTPMSQEVMNARGTIDKYMGDAMMAFWNAPLDDENHARHACDAALSMTEVLVPVNEKVKAQAEAEGRTFYELKAGIGLNTGPCAVGNMGSRQRFAYSALGDAVNLSSRLEGQTKSYGIDILAGENTYQQVPEYAWLEMDLIQVKGKEIPVHVYCLLGNEADAYMHEFQAWKVMHNRMLEAYRSQKFNDALRLIGEAEELDQQGKLQKCYDLYRSRIKAFQKDPPPADWDGVFVATTK